MPKKPALETDNSEPIGEEAIVVDFQAPKFPSTLEGVQAAHELSQSAMRLVESGIIAATDRGAIVWRAGHLEHIANLYASDPATTERNYADDLAVARAYSANVWERLTNDPIH
jgi:hypothetical protein